MPSSMSSQEGSGEIDSIPTTMVSHKKSRKGENIDVVSTQVFTLLKYTMIIRKPQTVSKYSISLSNYLSVVGRQTLMRGAIPRIIRSGKDKRAYSKMQKIPLKQMPPPLLKKRAEEDKNRPFSYWGKKRQRSGKVNFLLFSGNDGKCEKGGKGGEVKYRRFPPPLSKTPTGTFFRIFLLNRSSALVNLRSNFIAASPSPYFHLSFFKTTLSLPYFAYGLCQRSDNDAHNLVRKQT